MRRDLGKLDFFLIILVLLATLCGVINLYGQEVVNQDVYDSIFDYRWVRQSMRVLVGLALMFLIIAFHYQIIGSYALGIYIFCIVLLVYTLLFGNKVNGARSWVSIGSLNIGQPAEFAKLATIILLGKYLVLKEKDISKFSELMIPFAILLVPMALILKQPDFGTALSFIPIFFTMLFIGGADILQIGSLVFFGFSSIVIPLYVAYNKRVMVGDLVDYLNEQGLTQLAYASRVLGKDVWSITHGGGLSPELVEKGKLTAVFEKEENYGLLNNAVNFIKVESGGLLFRFFENYELILVLALLCIITAGVFFALRFATGSGNRNIMVPMGVLGITLLSSLVLNKYGSFSDYQINRLTAFVNPEEFKDRAGYQLRASRIATGSGRFFGKGLTYDGMTSGTRPLVPEASTDFSFASWAERTGFVGSTFLLIVLMAIPLRGLQVAFESKDRFGAILAGGITTMIFYHLFINIGIVLGLMPVTGLPLSFVSYGGSNLIVSLMAVGLLINIKLRKHAN